MSKIHMTTKHLLSFTLLILLSVSNIYAQEEELKHEMKLLARPLPDSIVLRWAPTTYQLWLSGNKYGYHVTRTTLIRNEKFVKEKAIRLTSDPLKPRPLEQWEPLADTDGYAGVAAQAIYGDGFEVETEKGETSIIDIMNKATEQENRLGFALFAADQSAEVARYSGLWLTDKNVKPGEKYLYRVFPAQVPEGMVVDTAIFYTGVDEYLPLPAPVDVKAEPGDRMVTLTWDKKYQSQFFNSFWIERSKDDGKHFRRLNDVPLVNTTPEGYDEADFHFYMDTLPDNATAFQYRVIGISVFGELSPPSQVVATQGIYKISSVPIMKALPGSTGETVELSWEFPNAKNEKIDGFRIYRSEKFDQDYQLLEEKLSAINQSYTDQQPLMTGYYRIQAFNHGFDGPQSIPKMVQLVDSIPPAIPSGLIAKADTSGLVRLTWTANKEKDIFGYRIFRANHIREEFSQLTVEPTPTNSYSDTINLETLTKEVYYKVVAIDQRQNKSGFSEVLKLERPDIVPPAAPVIKKISSSTNGITLQWHRSPSQDVEKQVLYRNRQGSREWEVVNTFLPDSTQTTDQPSLSGTIYRYLLIAVDKAGNESKPAAPVAGKYNAPKKQGVWITPKVKVNKKKGTVGLSWERPDQNVKQYLVYRKKEGGKWVLINTLSKNTIELPLFGKEKQSSFIIKTILK
ncbi:MAG: hypothetical protein JEZ14_21640 [Marinilabiliaceae bacterium]|nr:hypothetical protein [Marinilabiliaceae bacterium]